jgi:hypothetical protein
MAAEDLETAIDELADATRGLVARPNNEADRDKFREVAVAFPRAMSEGNHIDWASLEASKEKLDRHLIAKGIDTALATAEVGKSFMPSLGREGEPNE